MNFSIFAHIYNTMIIIMILKNLKMENNNTNSTLNNSRESVNKNNARYQNIGKSKTIAWNAKRSYRAY